MSVGQCVHSQGWAPGVLPLSMCSVLLSVYLGGGYSFPISISIARMCFPCVVAHMHMCMRVCVCACV